MPSRMRLRKESVPRTYAYLRYYGISEEQPFRNAKCVIRRGILVTSKKSVSFDAVKHISCVYSIDLFELNLLFGYETAQNHAVIRRSDSSGRLRKSIP